jgi:hypothetical protein
VERGLEVDTKDRGVIDRKFDDSADLVLVDAAFDRRDENYRASSIGQAVEGSQLLGQNA